MKKGMALFLALCMLIALAACGTTPTPATTEEPAKTENPAPSVAPAVTETTSDKPANYPAQPITFMVAWKAGGGSDLLTRAIAADFPAIVGQNANVTNREGAGGTIGFAEATGYAADGYNLLYSTSGVFSAQPLLREVEYSMDDFDYIAGIGEKPMCLAVQTSSGASNLDEWIAYLNENKTEAVFGTSGSAGSIPAFGIEVVLPALQEKGLGKYNVINYSGSGEAIPALLSGEINCAFMHPHEAKPYIDSGDFNVIAVATKERVENFPDLPTFAEQGIDFELAVFEGIIAPTGLDPEIRDYLEASILKILSDGPNYLAYKESSGHQVKPTSGEEFRLAVEAQSEMFQEMFGGQS